MSIQVSRCMSTQHPDNAATPFFSDHEVLQGETEVKEAYYAFSHLRCREQMWDCEGKEVDNFVVAKLLSRHEQFFREHPLGKDNFITLRVPNPSIEKSEAKVLLETLESIPRNYDSASAFSDSPPIFEVILPMTRSHLELERIANYYEQVVVGKQHMQLAKEDMTIGQWIGSFKPERINVIPLIEDLPGLLKADDLVGKFIEKKEQEYQRVFLARSDPALNYGSASAVLLNKIALQRLHALEEKTSTAILPIIGTGSAPFRGNLKPTNMRNCTAEYPSVQTFTLQSAFKYDYPEDAVISGIAQLNETKRSAPLQIDEEKALALVHKISARYEQHLRLLQDVINQLSVHVPKRRARRLHVGLFGYSRNLGEIRLPRAIGFCASLYSIGLPPELLGLAALDEKEFDSLRDIYVHFDEDMQDAVKFLNMKSLGFLPPKLAKDISYVLEYLEPPASDEHHDAITDSIRTAVSECKQHPLRDEIVQAALIRRFLG
ncbi:MAG: phosphoenolpyruvate carboxylase [Candidatus Burarchaeum sp.]|nr:phosphoenolpyruvate carboxylase [Candidatus Burarchaeum sp.]MDO8339249.1 phosphoenolpyruvate carboxylase [Candidatus Burarchaeum sp.]